MTKGELPMDPELNLNQRRAAKTRPYDAPPPSTAEIPSADVEEDAFFGDDSDNE